MYRSPLYREGDTEEEFSQRLLNQVEELLMFEGPHTIAAFCVESVTGTNGEKIWPRGCLWRGLLLTIFSFGQQVS